MTTDLVQEIKSLQKHLEKNPNSMLFARLADRYLQVKEVDRAIQICQQGLVSYTNYPTAHLVLARCFMAGRRFSEAEEQLKQTLSLEPRSLMALKVYSDLLLQMGITRSVAETFGKILEIDPLDSKINKTMMELSRKEGLQEPAVSSTALQTKMEPDEPLFVEWEKHPPLAPEIPKPVAQEPRPADQLAPSELQEEFISSPREDEVDLVPENFIEEEKRFSDILDKIFAPDIEKQVEEDLGNLQKLRELEEETTPSHSSKSETVTPDEPSFPTADELFKDFKPVSPPTESGSTSKISPEKRAPFAPQQGPAPESEREPTAETFPLGLTPDELFELEGRDSAAAQQAVEPEKDEFDEYLEDEEIQFGQFLSSLTEESGEVKSTDQVPENLDDFYISSQEADIETELPRPDDIEKPILDENDIDLLSNKREQKDRFVTPTLGEIYAAQGQYAKAISVFEQLVERHPENDWYRQKLEYLQKKLQEENSRR